MANFCPQCGSPTNPKHAFCENCGAKLIILEEPESVQEIKPEPPVSEPSVTGTTDHYVSTDFPDTPEYPGVEPEVSQDDFVIPRPGAAGNSEPVSPAPVQKPNPFIQPTGGTPSSVIPPAGNTSSVIPPAAGPARTSGRNLIPVILGLIALLAVALFFLIRKPEEPDPAAVSTPEPTPFAVKTPDVQIPTAPAITEQTAVPEPVPTQPAVTDVPQGMPYFIRYDIPCDASVNEDYRYPGIYDDGTDETAYGTLTFLSYISIPADEDLIEDGKENGFELEGYDLRSLSSQIDFTQEDASDRGVLITRYIGDYYDQDLLNDTYKTLTDNDGKDYYRYEIEHDGKRQYVYYYVVSEWKDWETYLEYTETDYFLVPSGYDGVIRGFVNPKSEDPSVDNEPENNFLFRIQ